ncbi:MAG: hypothetical protein J0H01_34895 [Rhizobiales bacterium]|nr:hypothetical protein [Hyphomicrobiales bacterium]
MAALWLLILLAFPGGPARALDETSPALRMARIDAIIATIKALPLLGAIIQDEPEAETALRLALAMDRPPYYNRSQDVLRALRTDYAVPALRAADDEALLALWARTSDLVQHLSAASPSLCRDLAFDAAPNRNGLEPRTRQLYEAMMRASEAAYHNGKGRPARLVAGQVDLDALALGLQMSTAEQTALADRAAAGADEFCAASAKLLGGLQILPMPTRALVMRWFLTAP